MGKTTSLQSEVSGVEPQVQKKYEYGLLVEYVKQGAWKNNTWLASVLGVDDDTVAAWKKTKPVIEARQEAVKGLLKDFTRRADVMNRLVENGFNVEPQKSELTVLIPLIDLSDAVRKNNSNE